MACALFTCDVLAIARAHVRTHGHARTPTRALTTTNVHTYTHTHIHNTHIRTRTRTLARARPSLRRRPQSSHSRALSPCVCVTSLQGDLEVQRLSSMLAACEARPGYAVTAPTSEFLAAAYFTYAGGVVPTALSE